MKLKCFVLSFLMGLFSGCGTLSRTKQIRFPKEKIRKLNHGMKADQVLELFGSPKKTIQMVCGLDRANDVRDCTFWYYGSISSELLSLSFIGHNPETMVLDSFDMYR